MFAKQTAWFTSGFGCTIADEHPTEFPEPHPVTNSEHPLLNALAERYGPGFDAQTPQLGWSMAKSVASLMAGQLTEQGLTDFTAADLQPEWQGDDPSAITVAHLLRMTSGLDWDETYDLGTPITEMLYIAPGMSAFAAEQDLAHLVDTLQQYSSGSTNILCDTLGQQTNADANPPRELYFDPLGLTVAVMEVDAAGVPGCSSYMWATPRE